MAVEYDDLYTDSQRRRRGRTRGAEIVRAENGYIVHSSKRVKMGTPPIPEGVSESQRAMWERVSDEYRWEPATYIAATFDDAMRMLAEHFGESATSPPAH